MSKKSKILYLAFILAVLAAVIFIGARNGDFGASLRAMTGIPRRYTLLCALCVAGGILAQALSAASALRRTGRRLPLPRAMSIAALWPKHRK